jgi:hypothetical protein
MVRFIERDIARRVTLVSLSFLEFSMEKISEIVCCKRFFSVRTMRGEIRSCSDYDCRIFRLCIDTIKNVAYRSEFHLNLLYI